jgi:hypothetical protein
MDRSRYQFTLAQMMEMIYHCAMVLLFVQPFVDKPALAIGGAAFYAALLRFVPPSRTRRNRLFQLPVREDSCGPIVWRGLDDTDEKN